MTHSVTFMLIFSHLIGMVKMLYYTFQLTFIRLWCACKSKTSTSIKLQDNFTCITGFQKKQPSRLSHQNMYNLRYKSLIFARSHDTLARWCLENHQNIWGDLLLCWKVAAMSSEDFWSWKSHACDLAKVGKYIMLAHELLILYLFPFVLLGAFESSNTSQCS